MNLIYLTFITLMVKNQSISVSSSPTTSSQIQNFCSKKINNCLSCKGPTCLFCNVFSGFYPNTDRTSCDSCTNNIVNCAFSLNCGACQFCTTGYTLCSGSCVKDITNCKNGNACTNICTQCNQHFFLSQGSCTPVTTSIPNCQDYSTLTSCSTCQSGYTLNSSSSSSTTSASVQTCILTNSSVNSNNTNNNKNSCFIQLGTNFSCNSCNKKSDNSDTFFNFNINNPYKLIENKILNEDINNLQTTILTYNSLNMFKDLFNKNSVCSSKQINNCLETNSSLNCIRCSANYNLVNGICLANAVNGANNCAEYGLNNMNSLNCIKCMDGYYLNNNLCDIINIQNCSIFNGDHSQCISCNNLAGYKLNNNSCISILNFNVVTNCITYTSSGQNEGQCSACETNYFLSNNTCITIENCTTVNTSITPIICTTCIEGYRVTSNNLTCEAIPSNLNCLKTDGSTNNCLTCTAGYFPINNVCTNQRNSINFISNCSKGLTNWSCQTCNELHQRVSIFYESRPTIQNCLFYNIPDGLCTLCEGNRTGSNCSGVGTTSNCSINQGTTCRSCNENYYYTSSNNTCIQPNINNSDNMCSHNPAGNYTFDISNSVTIPLNLTYNCAQCIINSFVPDTLTKTRCVPRLKSSSDNPYSDGDCSQIQIKVSFRQTSGSANVLTCRSIADIIGTTYENDANCAIYRNNLNNYIDFNTSSTGTDKTLCAICNSGYNIPSAPANSQCTIITNCTANTNMFGGCNSCNNGNSLNLSGETCVATIPNCSITLGNRCLKCANDYYGRLSAAINYTGDTGGIGVLLGFSGASLAVNFRDSNNVKIPSYRYFYHTMTTTTFSFTECSNTPLSAANSTFSSASGSAITGLNTRTLAVISTDTYPAFCRAGFYMKRTGSTFLCSEITGTGTNLNIVYNNFLTQSILKNCNSSILMISKSRAGGPFCFNFRTTNPAVDPLNINISAISNCDIYLSNWNYNSTDPTERTCLNCNSTNIITATGTCTAATASNKSIPCRSYNTVNGYESICNICPTGYSIVNNACIRSDENYATGANMAISNFITNNNCNILSWNINNPGINTNFSAISGSTPSPSCFICNENYVMNYNSYTCVKKNKFSFDNCISSQSGRGCIACMPGFINFGANINHDFCIAKPSNSTDYYIGSFDENCLTYNLFNNSSYRCNTCKPNYTLENFTCNQNLVIENCKTNLNRTTCAACNNGYYLNTNSVCVLGNVNKCLTYIEVNHCSKCEEGYTLFGSGNQFACINTISIRNSFGVNNCPKVVNERGVLYCFKLNGIIPLIPTPLRNSFCLPNFIENCLSFIAGYYTQCNECISDFITGSTTVRTRNRFIVQNNRCVPRPGNYIIPNCQVYANNLPLCEICENGYYKTKDSRCKINPNNNGNCKIKISNEPCKICNQDYYLNSSNICIKIDSTLTITNCYFYNSEQKCTICNRGYLLENNICVKLSGLTFIDSDRCEFNILNGYPDNKCICIGERYYFNNITKRCENLANCNIVNSNGTCKQCITGMYYSFNLNSCTSVTSVVSNCDLYINNGSCSRCNQNYGLKNNTCITVDTNDQITNCNSYTSNLECLLCKPGYYNENGICIILADTNIYYSLSSDKNLGLICKPGSEMDINRKCISNTQTSLSSSSNSYLILFKMIGIIIMFLK